MRGLLLSIRLIEATAKIVLPADSGVTMAKRQIIVLMTVASIYRKIYDLFLI